LGPRPSLMGGKMASSRLADQLLSWRSADVEEEEEEEEAEGGDRKTASMKKRHEWKAAILTAGAGWENAFVGIVKSEFTKLSFMR